MSRLSHQLQPRVHAEAASTLRSQTQLRRRLKKAGKWYMDTVQEYHQKAWRFRLPRCLEQSKRLGVPQHGPLLVSFHKVIPSKILEHLGPLGGGFFLGHSLRRKVSTPAQAARHAGVRFYILLSSRAEHIHARLTESGRRVCTAQKYCARGDLITSVGLVEPNCATLLRRERLSSTSRRIPSVQNFR